METDDKFTISLITQLFLSKNHALLSLILNPSTIDVFSMIIESNDFYKIGVTTQILISAFEKWPYDLICTLYKSNIFFSAILKSITEAREASPRPSTISASRLSPASLWELWGPAEAERPPF